MDDICSLGPEKLAWYADTDMTFNNRQTETVWLSQEDAETEKDAVSTGKTHRQTKSKRFITEYVQLRWQAKRCRLSFLYL